MQARLLAAAMSLAVILGTLSGLRPAKADTFSPDILNSVVSLLPQWPGAGRRPKEPEGTAVAVLPGGYLATNNHVIGRAKTVRIRLEDGRILPAEIIGRDAVTDLALVKAPVDLPVPTIGPEPKLGKRVCAIGNQFGLGLSVTCGVVSAVRRTGTGFNSVEDFIQTDAVINPGGSGGALVDDEGRLVGVISAIFTKESDANIGVNFASFINLVMPVVRDLKDRGRVVHENPGLKVRDLALDERRTGAGAFVLSVAPDGPAAKAGLKPGDIITNIGGRLIRKASDVATAVFYLGLGNGADVEYLREGAPKRAKFSLSRN
jgi:S1-C subfamily serine protease